MRNRSRHQQQLRSRACASRSTACRSRRGRRCSRACGATSGSSSAPTRTSRGGVCPMLAAHRAAGRTDFLSFAKSWDRFARAAARRARATARELRILVAQLEASLARRTERRARPRRSPSTAHSWRARAAPPQAAQDCRIPARTPPAAIRARGALRRSARRPPRSVPRAPRGLAGRRPPLRGPLASARAADGRSQRRASS